MENSKNFHPTIIVKWTLSILSLEIEICNKNVIFHKVLPIFHGGGGKYAYNEKKYLIK